MMSQSLHLEGCDLQVAQYGRFIILRKSDDDNLSFPRLAQSIHDRSYPWIKEVIATEVELAIITQEDFRWEQLEMLKQLPSASTQQKKLYKAPLLIQDSADWRSIIEYTGRPKAEIIADLLETTYVLSMHGFQPGFLYLDGLPEYLHVPRKEVPAIKVPAGAVAIGGPYLGVYSSDSPGGWHVIGLAPLRWITKEELPMGGMRVGDAVNFHIVSTDEYHTLIASPMSLTQYNLKYNA